MRRNVEILLFTVAIVAGLVVVPAGKGFAGKPIRSAEHSLEANCFGLTSGTDSVAFDIVTSTSIGSSGYLLYWGPGLNPDVDNPTLQSSDQGPEPLTITRNGLTIDATLPLVDIDFNPTGQTATISGMSFTAEGDPFPFDSFRDGNRTVKVNGTLQPLTAISGTLQMPGGLTFDLSGCGGVASDFTSFETDPLTYVLSSRFGLTLDCDITNAYGSLGVFALADQQKDVFIFFVNFFPTAGSAQFGDGAPEGAIALTDRLVSGSVSMSDADTGEPAGTATFDGTMYDRQRLDLSENTDTGRDMVIGNSYKIRGTATMSPGGEVFDLSSCQVLDRRGQHIEHGSTL